MQNLQALPPCEFVKKFLSCVNNSNDLGNPNERWFLNIIELPQRLWQYPFVHKIIR